MDSFFLVRLLLSFLIGSIPFAVVAMWGTGIDITKVGSRNPGFNNVLRVASKGRALVALVGDMSKGYLALVALSRPADSPAVLWSFGLAAVLGHCFTPWLRFRGGKGVATTTGVLFFLDWKLAFAGGLLYPLFRVIGRRLGWAQEGAIASLIMLGAVTALILALRGTASGLFALGALTVVVLRHTANLRDVLFGKKAQAGT
ncbi:MAG: glycerol-3-phosphate acyltransferase [Acidobacteria bacterium]|nr:glycerol-3-phosphate acyltransferase [Acidobacteriota bacterium]